MNYYNSDNYEDIINLPHHVSQTRPQMPLSDWAVQFSPLQCTYEKTLIAAAD